MSTGLNETDLATLKATRRAAWTAAGAAIVGALLAFSSGLYQGLAANDRAVREHQSTVYSAVLAAADKFTAAVPAAEAAAQGAGRNINENWVAMNVAYDQLNNAAALINLTGSDEAIRQGVQLLTRAKDIQQKLGALNNAPASQAAAVARQVDATVSEFPAVETTYVAAARKDLVPRRSVWLRWLPA